MKKTKTKNPETRSHLAMVRFNDAEFLAVKLAAEAVRSTLAVYLRELAVGTHVRLPRSLPEPDRKLLATALSSLAEVVSRLDKIVAELELGDVPFESEMIRAVQHTSSALAIFESLTERFRCAADSIVSELERQ